MFGAALNTPNDPVRIGSLVTTELFDGLRDSLLWVCCQQLQHIHVLSHSGAGAMPSFQAFSQFIKDRR